MKTKVDTSVNLAGVRMKNPVMTASGTFGYGEEYAELLDVTRLGAVVVKGISLDPWMGNPTPRLVEVPAGLVNSIGLQNPGVKRFIGEYMPRLRKFGVPVIVNIWGRSEKEYVEVATILDDVEGIGGLELNISCPNIRAGGIAFGTDEKTTAEVISAVRKQTGLPLIPKLSPNVPQIAVFARIAEESGADALSLINTIPAMVIDIDTRRPFLGNVTGGLSGPAIRPVAVKQVWEASTAVKIPVIGMGGITSADDAIEFLIAGASAVAVGTATFTDPDTCLKVIEGIERYLDKQGISSVGDLVGTLET